MCICAALMCVQLTCTEPAKEVGAESAILPSPTSSFGISDRTRVHYSKWLLTVLADIVLDQHYLQVILSEHTKTF